LGFVDIFMRPHQFGLYPHLLRDAALLIAETMDFYHLDEFIISGVPTSASALAVATALQTNKQLLELRVSEKDHGAYNKIDSSPWTVQGNIPNQQILVIEDAIVSGKNCTEFCKSLRQRDFYVSNIICFVDARKYSHQDSFIPTDISVYSVFSTDELRNLVRQVKSTC